VSWPHRDDVAHFIGRGPAPVAAADPLVARWLAWLATAVVALAVCSWMALNWHAAPAPASAPHAAPGAAAQPAAR
jgi:hypothetical protein